VIVDQSIFPIAFFDTFSIANVSGAL